MKTLAKDPSDLGTNIRRRRISTGKSQVEIAAAAALSRVGYRNIERGAAVPRVDSLARIASALQMTLDDLLAPARPLRAVRFRAEKRLTSREDTVADIARSLADYNDLEARLDAARPFVFAGLRRDLEDLAPGDIRSARAAALARRAAGVSEGEAIRDLTGRLEDCGVKVLTPRVASNGFFGLSVAEQDGGPSVVVNVWDRITVERWIFTAAHELGHLLLHLDSYDVTLTAENKQEEREADAFASQFLMPPGAFEQAWAEARGLSLVERVLKVKRIFRVSYRTVLYRVASQSRDPRWVWPRFFSEYTAATGKSLDRTAEPARLVQSDFVRGRLGRLVRAAHEKKIIDLPRAAEILRIDPDAMRSIIESWSADDEREPLMTESNSTEGAGPTTPAPLAALGTDLPISRPTPSTSKPAVRRSRRP